MSDSGHNQGFFQQFLSWVSGAISIATRVNSTRNASWTENDVHLGERSTYTGKIESKRSTATIPQVTMNETFIRTGL